MENDGSESDNEFQVFLPVLHDLMAVLLTSSCRLKRPPQDSKKLGQGPRRTQLAIILIQKFPQHGTARSIKVPLRSLGAWEMQTRT